MKSLVLMFFMICICSQYASIADVEEQLNQINIHEYVDEPLFISLGSWCNIALNLRTNGMRKAAFPFDWITSVDCEKFLEILITDFKYFLDDEYLFFKDNHFFNNYYKLEFLHELPRDRGLNPATTEEWAAFKEKYIRRINRFKELENYKGKVYFLRSSFGYSNHPQRRFKCAENVSISDTYACALYNTLKKRFPRLDFTLIICDIGKEEKKLSESLIRLQSVPDLNKINKIFFP